MWRSLNLAVTSLHKIFHRLSKHNAIHHFVYVKVNFTTSKNELAFMRPTLVLFLVI